MNIKEKQIKNTSKAHKKNVPLSVNLAVITLSNTRTLEEDDSGALIQEIAEKNNHNVLLRKVLPDDRGILETTINDILKNKNIQVIITNGGTGLTKKDITIETLKPQFEKEIPGFSTLFWLLGYQQAESATMLSRAMAGIMDGRVVFCLPGSPRACRMALEKLVMPEIGHILKHINE